MRRVASFLVMAVTTILLGCGSATPSPQPVTPAVQLPDPTVTPTAVPPTATAVPTQMPLPPTRTSTSAQPSLTTQDCGINILVGAWIDQDIDGLHDLPDEPPLAGVTFVVAGAEPGYERNLTTKTDGKARVFMFPMACPAIQFEVYAEVPSGYRVTTPIRTVAKEFQLFEVGFVPEP
jgi:hypothetical protein